MKRFLSLAMVLIICTTALAGCSNGGKSTSDETKPTVSTEQSTPAPSEKPAEPVKIVWYWNEGNVQLPDDSYICKKIKEDLNITYVHVSPKGTDYEERLQLLLASQDVPDVITSYPMLTVNLKKWGVIVPIEKYLTAEYIPNVIRIQKNWDLAIKYQTWPDDHIYGMPNCNSSNVTTTTYIRHDWLKNLGLEVPKTLDELKDVLVKFSKNDPDKNGKNDTIGTVCNEFWGTLDFAFEMAATPGTWYKGENGNAIMGMFLPRHKDYLKYLKSLIDSGAMDKEIATIKFDQVNEKIKAGKVGFLFNWNDYSFNNEIKKVQPDCDWRPMSPPKGAYDKGYLGGSGILREEYCISSKSKNIEAIFKLMNYMADDKSTADKLDFTGTYWPMMLGEKGVNWDVSPDGKLISGANCSDPKIAERDKVDTWVGRARRFCNQFDRAWRISQAPDFQKVLDEIDTYPLSISIPDSDPNKAINTEPLVMPEDVAKFADEWMYTKWPEFFYKAVLGKVDIDKGWADFMAQAEKAGLEQINENMTKALKDKNLLK